MNSTSAVKTLALLFTFAVTAVLVGLFAARAVDVRQTDVSQVNGGLLSGRNITVYKSPSCTCCTHYVEYLQEHGMNVEVVSTDAPTAIKQQFGVADEAASCHTMRLEGYTVEGHVPIEALERLVREQPGLDGIALPRMPGGSPGMSGEKSAPFTIYGFGEGGLFVYGLF